MPRLELIDGCVHVQLSLAERLLALTWSFRVPLAQVLAVRVSLHPWSERASLWSGVRVGTGLPYVVLLGRLVSWRRCTFVSVRSNGTPALVLDLHPGAAWARVVVAMGEAVAVADAIQAERDKHGQLPKA